MNVDMLENNEILIPDNGTWYLWARDYVGNTSNSKELKFSDNLVF